MRRIGLRSAVAALVLVIVGPLTIVGGIGIERARSRLIANLNRQNISTVRAISVAVDQEIQGAEATLNVLGELHAFDTPDIPAFESLAARLLPYQPNWSAIMLTDAEGILIDGVPDKNDGGAAVGAGYASWSRATAARNVPLVSDLFSLPDMPGHFVIVSVPVARNGKVAFVLGARVRSEAFSAILRRQAAAPNGSVGLVDPHGVVIARTKDEDKFVGTSVTPEFIKQLAAEKEGSWKPTARDGTVNYSSFSTSPRTGLVVALGAPATDVEEPIRRLVMYLSGFWLLIIGSGAVLGFFLGGAIVKSLRIASKAALALSRDDDVTTKRSRIAEIDDLATGLRAASETLKAHNRERDEAARIKDEFLMTVSHELRTPLTAIVGWARMLSTGQIREAQRAHAISAVERNANALHQLVNDLLDVSRIVSGNLRLETQPVMLADVVSAAVDSVRPAIEAKNISVVVDVDKAAAVRGDAGRLQQVVWNLLANAARFTPGGGRIDIGVRRTNNDAVITVRDSGTGIAPNFITHVFDRFRQAESGTTRAHGGLGLGLAIVRHLVELHGGTVSVANNTPHPGATFTVVLPLRTTFGPAAGEAARRVIAPASTHLENLEVLVVDDDRQSRELFAAILENAGAHVKAAASTDDALALLANEWPDVLVSDIEMPNQDGYELLRRARLMEAAHGRLPAVAVSAHARPDDHVRAMDNGFAWHMAKPVEPAELVKVVAMVAAQTPTIN